VLKHSKADSDDLSFRGTQFSGMNGIIKEGEAVPSVTFAKCLPWRLNKSHISTAHLKETKVAS
jgi:hypothetical protein